MINQGEIKNDVMIQGSISTSVGFFTDTILNDWIDKAHKWASGYKKWPFTEGRISTTYVSDASTEAGFTYPEGWKPDSIRLLQVGGKRFNKKNFYKYQEFREDYPDDTDKICSDFGRLYYINPKADVSGTTTLWGQYTPAKLDATDHTAETVFSDNAEGGNEAIAEEVLSYVKKKQNKLQESITHHKIAMDALNGIWQQIRDEQFAYQSTEGEGMFKRINIVSGDFQSDIHRHQF